jgi:histidinol-phosphate aminotransferase
MMIKATLDASGRSAMDLARASFRDIGIYDPHGEPCAVDLTDNTNLFGTPPSAERALHSLAGERMTRYPSLYADELLARLASYVGVASAAIVTGCGSDQVLDCAMRAFAEPGDRVAHMDPSFVIIPTFARLSGLEPVGVPLTKDFDLDADRMLDTGARIIYLCSPNNPTGTLASRAAIERVLERATGLVILDEAYAEFSGVSLAAEAPAHGRLLVVRTMSKAFALAGMRVGYGIGAPELVRELTKVRGPYTVTAPSEAAATAALTHDLGWMRAHAAEAVTNRERFVSALATRGLVALPSAANFILVPSPRAKEIALALRKRGIAVRAFTALPVVGDAIRLTIGPWPTMERVLKALDAGASKSARS